MAEGVSMAGTDDGHAAVAGRTRELVEALRSDPTIERFRAAEKRFRGDAELTRMQAGLRWNHERLQRAQKDGRHDARLFQEIRGAQSRLQRHPLVVEFVGARAAAQEILRSVNQEMAAILGLDVGATVGPAGAC